MPPLNSTALERFAPEKGNLTKESDRAAVELLTVEARKNLKKPRVGYEGEYHGTGDGRGKRVYSDGDVYEGEFKDGRPHGHGKVVFFHGDV